MTKRTVLLLYGGKSVEHEISIRSARNVHKNIDSSLFDSLLVWVSKKGEAFLQNEVIDSPDFSFPIQFHWSEKRCLITEKGTFSFDVVFNVIHGTTGEDGTVHGLFRMLNAPCVGSDVLGSAITMDKTLSKIILEKYGLPVVPFYAFTKHMIKEYPYSKVVEKLGEDLIVKAANLGSSVGVYKVMDELSYNQAILDVGLYTDKILVEKFIKCREIEVGILGNTTLESTWPGEIVLNAKYEFYSYQAKYEDEDSTSVVIPADLKETELVEIRKIAEKAFSVLECKDFARVDLFRSLTGEIYVNEINTLPGFTSISMYPMLWQYMGISYSELITRIINLAEQRWSLQQTINSNYK